MSDEWKQRGACRELDPELWYPERAGGTQGDTRAAKQTCGWCPVRLECLVYALERREPYGIWGGMTTPERRKVLARKNAEAVA